MIPIRLEFQAFGSYVQRQIIDFTQFEDGETFLIHGKTGSGKTTIIDAMSFALYGNSSGNNRNELQSMRCKSIHAKNIPTEIEFVFSAKDEVYKFTRKCWEREITRGKNKGELVVEVDQNAFRLVDESFEPIFENPKIDNLLKKAEELVGLNYKQFIQVMVLPQGKFESFLVAPSGEKEEILSTLFDVEDWKKIADWICQQAAEINEKNKSLKNIAQHILDSEECENLQELDEKVNDLKDKNNQFESEIKKGNTEKKSLEETLVKSRELMKSYTEYEKAEEEYSKLIKQKEIFKNLKIEVAKNRKAAEIKPYYDRCKQDKKALKERETKSFEAETSLQKAIKDYKNSVDQLEKTEKNKAEIDKIKAALPSLESSFSVFEDLDKAVNAKKQADDEISKISNKLGKTESDYKEIENSLGKLKKQREIILSHVEMIPELTLKKKDIEETIKLQNGFNNHNAECEKQKKVIDDIKKVCQASQEELDLKNIERDEKYRIHIKGLAFSLAEKLEEGTPCAVCGSIHHPSPAKTAEQLVSEKEINELNEEVSKLSQRHIANEGKLSKLDGQYKSAIQKLDEIKTSFENMPKYSQQEAALIIADYNQYTKEKGQIPSLKEQESAMQASLDKLTSQIETLKSQLVDFTTESKTQQGIHKSLSQQVSKNKELLEIKNLKQLQERITHFKKNISDYDKKLESCKNQIDLKKVQQAKADENIKSALSELKNAKEQYNKTVENYKLQMEKRGFNSRNEFEPYLVDEGKIDEKQKRIDNYKGQLAVWEKDVEKYKKEISDTQKPDVKNIEEQLEEKTKALEEMQNIYGKNQNELVRLIENVKKYRDNIGEFKKGREDYDKLSRFGKDIRGDNSIGLRRFVLSIMLEKVVWQANELLKGVKGGQFKLVVNRDEKEGRNRQYGLDLWVESTKTSQPYSVRFLSGGEKFIVAVALSLALSAVVQMQSGGTKIEALFIDEGFGSLDPNALDEAMEILLSMSGTRKMLGIISHVESMKETIPRQILVTSDNKGSHLQII